MNVLYLFVFACIILWLPLTSKTISSDTSNKHFRLDSSLRNRLILPDAAFDNVLISGEKNSATSNLGKSSFFFIIILNFLEILGISWVGHDLQV